MVRIIKVNLSWSRT